jgi:hypothetical protein
MATSVERGSATIYQFPPRGRYAASVVSSAPERAAGATQPANIMFGSGWYHDEAIEAERGRKN